MRNEPVIWAALSLLLLCEGGVCAREIPVYREYTRSVQFYDDRGAIQTEHQQGPDQVRLRLLRDSKAQEAYLGKETLLDLGFESSESVFSSRRSAVAVTVPSASSSRSDSSRRKKKESGQNWLAGSLALPSLGQAPTNAAVSAISAGAPDSGWGWLANEVSGQSGENPALTADVFAEEELSLGLSPEGAASGSDQINPYSTTPMESSSEFQDADERGMAGAFSGDDRTGTFRDEEGSGENSEEGSFDPARAPAPEWGSSRTDASTIKDYSVPSGMADMSRTRAIISEWSVEARPDFSSVATVGARGNRAGVLDRASSAISSSVLDGKSHSSWRESSLMGRSSAALTSSGQTPSWKGGWNSRQQKTSFPLQFKQISDPVVIPAIPNSTVDRSAPSRSSGGYKPAWY